MAVCFGRYGEEKKVEYEGCVIDLREHNGSCDSDWYAIVWDAEHGEVREVMYDTTRFGGTDSWATIDATEETMRAVYRYYKGISRKDFDGRYNEAQAKKIRMGDSVKVVRGRKVPKGTTGKIGWIGKNYNYYSGQYEERAGIEANGEKVFVPANYVEVIDWEQRMLTGNARKKEIRRITISRIPGRYRNIF